jgi:endogenous inhibitor of DNA gyrase (YacG/DUF329 family)
MNALVVNKCGACGKDVESFQSQSKKYCDMKCRNIGMTGRKLTTEHVLNISKSLKGTTPKNMFQSGENHPFWNPDRTDQRERLTGKYRDWRFGVIKRDKYTCQICGDKRSSGKKFHVDHIKPFALYPELRLDVDNGRVLCIDCHKRTDTYARKRYYKFVTGSEDATKAI